MAEGERRGEGFLARWSRLKRGEEAPPATPPATPAPETQPQPRPPAAEAPASPAPEAAQEPPIDLASLPPVESLTAESDITAFLRQGVPAALRNAALRRVWSLDPTIRDFIGPADYAWDWNVPGGAPGYAAQIASGPDVEALADRILGLVRDNAKGEPAAEAGEAEAPVAAAPPEGEALSPVPPAPVRLSDGSGAEPQAPAPTPGEPPATPAAVAGPARAPLPRPRHGGAVPT
jgi:hypothetical protein